jgi:hypothetical protein
MGFYDNVLRRWSPRRYYQRSLRDLSEQIHRLEPSKSAEEEQVIQHLQGGRLELYEKLRSIEDQELRDKANRLDIDFGELPLPENRASHYESGSFEDELLIESSRLELKRLVRERALINRNERREKLKILVTIIGALTGLLGVAVAFYALTIKKS